MSAFKHLLNQAHRYSHYCSTKTTRPGFSFALYLRPFSSFPPESTAPVPETNGPNSNQRTPVSIQPVSYAVKKPENQPPPPASESQAQGTASQSPSRPPPETPDGPGDGIRPENIRAWTREDFRFVKDDVPNISPVSYLPRVAPLPEDWVTTEEVKEDDGKNVEQEGNDELERERRRIDVDNRNMMMRAFNVQGEKVPFPTLIRTEQARKKEKIVYDLKEAIRFIKANAKCDFEETVEAHIKLTPELRKSHLVGGALSCHNISCLSFLSLFPSNH